MTCYIDGEIIAMFLIHNPKKYILLISLMFQYCGDQFMAKTADPQRSAPLSLQTDSAGNISGTVSADGGAIAGADGSVSFAPGSLSVSTKVIVGSGSGLANSSIGSELGITNNTFTSASSAVAVVPAVITQMTSPMTISVSFTAPSLNLSANDYYVILFRGTLGDGKTVVGVIPASALSFNSKSVYFKASYWGVYQLAKVIVPITQFIAKDSAIKSPGLKTDPNVPAPSLIGSWFSNCISTSLGGGGAPQPAGTTFGGDQIQSRSILMSFANDFTFSRTEIEFSSASCSGSFSHSQSTTGVYKTGLQFGSGFAIDLTIKGTKEAYGTLTQVTYVNQTTKCGFSDWAINVPKDTSQCLNNGTTDVGKIIYTIYQIESSGTVFRFGADTGDKSNATLASRTTDLNPDTQKNLIKN